MTRIRKINQSQVEGSDANQNDANEIRPLGEMAVYVGQNDKLELLMFDGARTHLQSKVLSKGTFYGGDADSGDGAGLDTIKLIPDAELHHNEGSYGNDQYIVIDPTNPNHIHIRAGGAIDSSTADLFLGGEENHVGVSDSGDRVTIRTNDTNTWTFGTDGTLQYPHNVVQQPTGTVTCAGNTSTVVYTASGQHQQTIKLLIQVEGNVDAEINWDTQACEIMVAKSWRAHDIASTVYGIVHTSVAPLATFTAEWNTLTNRVQVLCTTPSANSVYVRTFATEIYTAD